MSLNAHSRDNFALPGYTQQNNEVLRLHKGNYAFSYCVSMTSITKSYKLCKGVIKKKKKIEY